MENQINEIIRWIILLAGIFLFVITTFMVITTAIVLRKIDLKACAECYIKVFLMFYMPGSFSYSCV